LGIEDLDARDTDVGDRGAKIIGKLKSLKSLDLFRTKLTDQGMRELERLTELETLNL